MARKAKPWFNRQSGWWMAYINGKKERLAFGRQNKQAAEAKLLQLRLVAATNVGVEEVDQTVASVIEHYLAFAVDVLATTTQEIRFPYLQSFAEMHGWRRVADCRPSHMRDWLKAHPKWVSDWTKNGAIRNVQVAFNWAAGEERLIKENPLRGRHPPYRRSQTAADRRRFLARRTYGSGPQRAHSGNDGRSGYGSRAVHGQRRLSRRGACAALSREAIPPFPRQRPRTAGGDHQRPGCDSLFR